MRICMFCKLAYFPADLRSFVAIAALLALFMVPLQAEERPTKATDSADQSPSVVNIAIDAKTIVRQALPDTFFGFNIRWSNFEKDLWDKDNDHVKPRIVDALKPFKGAMYRYPGGLVANEYIWEQSVLPIQQRKSAGHSLVEGERPPLFGVREYLDFVEQVEGSPFYTLNIVGKGKPSDIQEYPSEKMAESNRQLAEYIKKHTPDKKVRYYQLGNELDRNHYQWPHEKYIKRSRDTIDAIQNVDKDARFIAFLREFNWRYRGDKKGVSRSEDFIRDVLTGLPMVNDYSLHFYYDGSFKPGAKFKHIQDVVSRVQRTLSIANSVKGGMPLNVWVTEHSRLLRVNRENEQTAKTYTTNLQAALSSADFLTAMAQIPEIKGTALQALNGVGRQVFDASVEFGDLRPLPVYWALRILNYGREGAVLSTTAEGPADSGYPGGYDVRAVALANGADDLAIWVVNRALTSLDCDIRYIPFKGQAMEMQHYYLAGKEGVDADKVGNDYKVDIKPAWQNVGFSENGVLSVGLPPSSVSTFILRRRSRSN